MPRMLGMWIAAIMVAVLSFSVARAAPLEAYGALPGLEMAALSPSGASYAVVGAVGGERKLAVISTDGRPQLTVPVGEHKVRRIAWAGEDKVVVWTSGATSFGPQFNLLKYEVQQVVVLNLKTRKSFWVLTEGPMGNGVWGTYGLAEEEGGRWYGYFGGVTYATSGLNKEVYFFEDGHPDIYRVDLETGETRLHANKGEGVVSNDWVIGPDGQYVATLELNARYGDWRVREGRRGIDLATGKDLRGRVWLSGKGRADGTVLYGHVREDGEDEWVEVPSAGGPGQTLFAGERVLREFRDRASGLLIGYVADGDRPQARFFDARREKRMRATERAFPGLNVRLEAWNDAFDKLVVFVDGKGDSGTWWLVDITTGKAEEIGRAYPAVRSAEVGETRMVSWTAADGAPMHGVLTLPAGKAAGLPLVVLPHGGPAMRDYPQFDWWAQAFAARGYAVFQPNFRGSEGYGAKFRDAGDGQWGRTMQTDISDGVAELGRQGLVDPRRACIAGINYGGYAALAGVTVQNGLYRCAVAVGGISDLPKMRDYVGDARGRGGPALRNWRENIGEGEALETYSPARLAARADAPVLLVHGKDDVVVPIEQARVMERALKAAGKPVSFVELKGEDHWLSRGDTRLAMLKAAVAFVEKHNPAN